MAVFMLGALMPVGLWATRNYVAYDRFIMINCAGGISFWKGNNETYAAFGKAGIEYVGEESAAPRTAFMAESAKINEQVASLGPVGIADRARASGMAARDGICAPRPGALRSFDLEKVPPLLESVPRCGE